MLSIWEPALHCKNGVKVIDIWNIFKMMANWCSTCIPLWSFFKISKNFILHEILKFNKKEVQNWNSAKYARGLVTSIFLSNQNQKHAYKMFK